MRRIGKRTDASLIVRPLENAPPAENAEAATYVCKSLQLDWHIPAQSFPKLL
jgi:hypothetical protein